MRRMDKITGRSDDMLIVRGVNLFPTQVEELILQMPELAAQYQLVLTRSGNLDELEIVTEVRPEHDSLGAEDRNGLAGRLGQAVKGHIGVNAKITVRGAGQIERTVNGKARRVFDHRTA